MMADGLVEEVRSLSEYRDTLALRTVGYTEIFNCLDGKCTLDQAVSDIKTNTRHYAKRQMTWWKRDKDIRWIEL
jgi:tRNA dimethylallyltransferase